jgi:ribosome biogenesis protein YTM1
MEPPPAEPSAEPSDPLVEVRFTTRDARWRVSDAPIQLPTRLTRAGLSEVINHLLAADDSGYKSRPFDFLLEGELLRGPLGKALAKQGLSGEAVATLEYIECVPPPKPERTSAHQDWLGALAAHPGGSGLMLAGCYNHAAYVWDAEGRQRAELAGHTAAVKAVAWLRGSDAAMMRAATGSKDHTVRMWRLEQASRDSAMTCVCEASLVGHTSSVESLTANPSADRLCSGAWDGGLHLWSLEDVAEAAARTGGNGGSDGQSSKRAKGQRGSSAQTASAPADVSPKATFTGHQGSVNALCWPTAALIYSGSWDGTIREWQVDVETTSATLAGQPAVLCLDVSLESALVASGHSDHALRIWDSRLQSSAMRLRLAHKGWVSDVRWCPHRPQLLASACYDGSVRLWDVRSTIPLHEITKHEGKALCVAWDGAERVASGGSDAQMRTASLALSGGE